MLQLTQSPSAFHMQSERERTFALLLSSCCVFSGQDVVSITKDVDRHNGCGKTGVRRGEWAEGFREVGLGIGGVIVEVGEGIMFLRFDFVYHGCLIIANSRRLVFFLISSYR